jgi:hypothetical protein
MGLIFVDQRLVNAANENISLPFCLEEFFKLGERLGFRFDGIGRLAGRARLEKLIP